MKGPIQKVRGAILIMAALILVLLIGVAAFALDLGRLYVLNTEMQNAVDAAVLSAAAELDGEGGAIDRAKEAANQDILNHRAHFSKQIALLKDLEDESVSTSEAPGVYTFYSWIGSKYDSSDVPSGCTPDVDGRCQTTSADDASYVQIDLNPALFSGGDADVRYEIDLYFLPILSLFGIDTANTASTRVVALAGSHSEVCDYPPVFVCDPFEGDPTVNLQPGEMVLFHTQGDPAVNGGFGWLMPGYSKDDLWDDGLGPNSNELFYRRLGSIWPLDCGSPIVTINTGDMSNPTGDAINTRFGLYPQAFNFNAAKNVTSFPSAPNVVDYPRDAGMTVSTDVDGAGNAVDCEASGAIHGAGTWGGSLCNTAPEIQPSTFTRNDYDLNFHDGNFVDSTSTESRYDIYHRELNSDLPVSSIATDELQSTECQCDIKGRSFGPGCTPNACRMSAGEPDVAPNPDIPDAYVGLDDAHERRELFLAMVACSEVDFGASNKVIDLAATNTKWARFFLTEHVGNPSDAMVYAEFIEEVTDKEDRHFKKVIQLYE